MSAVLALCACTAAPTTVQPTYDVSGLLEPESRFVGVSLDGPPGSTAPLDDYTAKIGKRPSLVGYFASWGEEFDTVGARRIFDYGALPFLSWEPFSKSLDAIAAGDSDYYVWNFASHVRRASVPVVISFGHEMNASWYPWGAPVNSSASFVNAWRRIHDIFRNVGATNVIWIWSPNIVNPVPHIALAPLYPGDEYVDWVGLVGYYRYETRTFSTVFQPTIDLVHAFTKKPIIIAETGVEPGLGRADQVTDLLSSVVHRPNVIGLVYFERRKQGRAEADWRIAVDPPALEAFRAGVASPVFGGLAT